MTGSRLLAQLPAVAAELQAVEETAAGSSSTSGTSSNRGVSGFFGPVARTLGRGLTLGPLIGGLFKLLGGGDREAEEPVESPRFTLPPAIRAEAGLGRDGETFLIDRGASDEIRRLPGLGDIADRDTASLLYGPQAAADSAVSLSRRTSASRQAEPERIETAAAPSVTVNVQAMDSQSFLDRREDIARAVREAMLHSHSVNDVVSEL